jgi:hypothetical protein
MSRYILIRRLRGPAFLLLIGIVALLHQTGVVYHMWRLFWPLALILWGLLLLAERAALELEGYPTAYGDPSYPGGQYAQPPVGGPGPGVPPAPGSAIVPANSDDLGRTNGGQL